ncbi:MAG: hypothetical protein HZA14_10620 [Nitrospirae bacterium]|nr:hypothetical protein [Nitrospirota bacterium]
MKYVTALITFAASFILSHTNVFAWHEEPVTPYGGFCPKCEYGTCKSTLTSYEGQKALEDYYGGKGLQVELDGIHGRFIRARVIDKGKIVDVIIFDRSTGRIRSIY